MATRWPADVLDIGGRRVWGRVWGISAEADPVDALGDELLPAPARRGQTVTASASIRGDAEVGAILTDPRGVRWTVTGSRPPDTRWGGATELTLEQGVIVEDDDA